jgi:hypothetical protein
MIASISFDKDMWNDLSERKVKEAGISVIIMDCHPIKLEVAREGVPAVVDLLNSNPESGIYLIDVNEIMKKKT